MAMNPVTKLEPEGGDAQQTSAIEMAAHPMSDNHHVQEQKPMTIVSPSKNTCTGRKYRALMNAMRTLVTITPSVER